jgi:hypothetical protein
MRVSVTYYLLTTPHNRFHRDNYSRVFDINLDIKTPNRALEERFRLSCKGRFQADNLAPNADGLPSRNRKTRIILPPLSWIMDDGGRKLPLTITHITLRTLITTKVIFNNPLLLGVRNSSGV